MHIDLIQDIIERIRGKKHGNCKKNIIGKNNINIPNGIKNKVGLNIIGENNTIVCAESNKIKGNIIINIYGDNNKIVIGENLRLSDLITISIGQKHYNFGKANNSNFVIAQNTSIESLNYVTFNSNTFCDIEEECMFSTGITIYNTDGHPIFRKGTKEILNKIKGITIGKHSWVGMNATILKNSIVPSNSIIGCNSVFSGGGEYQPYCVFAGNPARVVKENVDWQANGAECGYIENE